MAYLLADAKVTIIRRICSAGMKNVISRFARGGQRGELSSYFSERKHLNNLKNDRGSSKGEQFLQKERNPMEISEFLKFLAEREVSLAEGEAPYVYKEEVEK